MELRQLRYFVRIAELGSMSRASRALHIAQPSLSQQIAQLEDELGKQLLTRIPSGVRMTAEGEIFYREAQQILRQVENARAAVSSAQATLAGRVRIGLPATQAIQYALPLIVATRQLHPRIELEVFEETSSDLLQGIASCRHDFGMVINEDDAQLLEAEPVLEEELFLLSRADQAPATAAVTLADLAALPLALPGPGQIAARLAEALDGDPAVRPQHRWIVVNSVSVYRQAVLAGLAHSIVPWGVLLDELDAGRVRATPFLPPLTRTVHLCTARGAALSQAARAVRTVLLSVLRERVEDRHYRGITLLL